jgi:transcriptional regulator with XRE-family HTH domain
MTFNWEAFTAILDRSNYASPTDFAKAAGISAGTLHDISKPQVTTGRPRRNPSPALIRRLAGELRVPVTALIGDPSDEKVAS